MVKEVTLSFLISCCGASILNFWSCLSNTTFSLEYLMVIVVTLPTFRGQKYNKIKNRLYNCIPCTNSSERDRKKNREVRDYSVFLNVKIESVVLSRQTPIQSILLLNILFINNTWDIGSVWNIEHSSCVSRMSPCIEYCGFYPDTGSGWDNSKDRLSEKDEKLFPCLITTEKCLFLFVWYRN